MAGRAGYAAGASSALIELLRRTDAGGAHRSVLREALRVLAELPESTMAPQRRRALAAELRAKAKGP